MTTGRATAHAPLDRRRPPRLAAPAFDSWRILHIQQRYGVVRLLKIGPDIVRGSPREPLDARIVNDRLVELHHDREDQRQDPAVVLPRNLPGEDWGKRDATAPLKVISYFSNGSMVRL